MIPVSGFCTTAWCMMAVDLVMLTAPDGKYLAVAPSQIVALRGPVPDGHGHFHGSVHCVVYTADGKFLGVTETCAQVARKLGW